MGDGEGDGEGDDDNDLDARAAMACSVIERAAHASRIRDFTMLKTTFHT